MVYFCSHCQKYHADNYKRHLRYKITDVGTKKEEPDIEKLKSEIKKIKETMGLWAVYIQRKHPYWKIDKEFEEWIND